MIKVVFFASLKEKLNCDKITIEYYDGIDIEQLKFELIAKGLLWKEAFANEVLVAVDQEMVYANTQLSNGAEVAFFPPVTGG